MPSSALSFKNCLLKLWCNWISLLMKVRSLDFLLWCTLMKQLFYIISSQRLGISFYYLLILALIPSVFTVSYSQPICTVFVIVCQVIFLHSGWISLTFILAQFLSVGYVHFHHPPSQDRPFKRSRPSRGPAKGHFSSTHLACNFASRGFLSIPHIDVSFIILSKINNYVFIPMFICSMFAPSIRLKTAIIGHVFLSTSVSWHMTAIGQTPLDCKISKESDHDWLSEETHIP